jgi:hypothetical protein
LACRSRGYGSCPGRNGFVVSSTRWSRRRREITG